MADYLPAFDGGTLTFTASADVVGGQTLEITGVRTVGPAGAASTKYVGVAAFSAKSGEKVTVVLPGKIQRLTAAGAIAAGDIVRTGADGTVEAGTELAPVLFTTAIGKALTAATLADDIVLVADRI